MSRMTSRSIVNWIGSSKPGRSMLTVTSVPGRPRSSWTASSVSMLSGSHSGDLEELVSRAYADTLSGTARDRRHDRDKPLPIRDLQAHAPILTLRADAEVLVVPRLDERRVRVLEVAQDRVDRGTS